MPFSRAISLSLAAISVAQSCAPLVDVPAEAGGVLGADAVFGGLDHEFLRHAADIDAGAAPETFLRDADPRAMPGGDARAAHAGGTAADHE